MTICLSLGNDCKNTYILILFQYEMKLSMLGELFVIFTAMCYSLPITIKWSSSFLYLGIGILWQQFREERSEVYECVEEQFASTLSPSNTASKHATGKGHLRYAPILWGWEGTEKSDDIEDG